MAVIMRPVGGMWSDRFSPEQVMRCVFGAVAVLALVAALELPLIPVGTIAFLGMAAALGAGAGGVFALVARMVPPEKVGSVTGVVGAAGGLGGFFPPLVMGAVYSAAGSYAWGFVLLALTAATALLYTAAVYRHPVT